MPYGYLGQNTPNQTVSNSGVFSISDVASLEKQGKFGGSLELIEEQNPSASSTVDFTTLNNYDVHYLTFNYEATSNTETQLRFSNDGGTSYIASGYQYAMQYGASGGFTSQPQSTSATYIRTAGTTTANNRIQGYIYFYNLLNSLKYSFITTHNFWYNSGVSYGDIYQFGGGVLATAEIHNAIRVLGSGTITGNFKLYGVKQI